MTDPIDIDFEGRRIPAQRGEPVAVALWRAGQLTLSRSVKYHRPRGAFCFAESCGNCLMRVGGKPDRLACAVPCEPGLTVETQNALPSAQHDLLRAVDWAFPNGFEPHELFAGVPLASAVTQKVARQLAGLGKLPDAGRTADAPPERALDVCVIGLGRAGRAAAQAARGDALADVLAIDGDPWMAPLPDVPCWIGARALGLYRDGGTPLLAVRYQGALHRLRPKRVILCTGSREQNLLFEGNDLPGIVGARAVRRLLDRHQLLPGKRALILGDGPEAAPAAAALLAAGAEVAWAGNGEGPSGVERLAGLHPRAARGRGHVQELLLEADGRRVRWRGDLVAVAAARSAAFELGVQAGLSVERQGTRGFALTAGPDGETSLHWLRAAGSCTSAGLPSEDHGWRAGAAP